MRLIIGANRKNYEKNKYDYVGPIGMLPAIEIIPERRRKLGLTQNQLASLAGVSQSYIAKLEAGKIEPSYLKVKKIFEALDKIEKKKEVQASEIMTRNPVVVQQTDTIQEVIEVMRSKGFSQVPVFEGDKPVGGISERTLLDHMLYEENDVPASQKIVKDVMEESWPTVSEDAPLSLLSSLLRYYPAVLVQRQGRIVGIVTKADLLSVLTA